MKTSTKKFIQDSVTAILEAVDAHNEKNDGRRERTTPPDCPVDAESKSWFVVYSSLHKEMGLLYRCNLPKNTPATLGAYGFLNGAYCYEITQIEVDDMLGCYFITASIEQITSYFDNHYINTYHEKAFFPITETGPDTTAREQYKYVNGHFDIVNNTYVVEFIKNYDIKVCVYKANSWAKMMDPETDIKLKGVSITVKMQEDPRCDYFNINNTCIDVMELAKLVAAISEFNINVDIISLFDVAAVKNVTLHDLRALLSDIESYTKTQRGC